MKKLLCGGGLGEDLAEDTEAVHSSRRVGPDGDASHPRRQARGSVNQATNQHGNGLVASATVIVKTKMGKVDGWINSAPERRTVGLDAALLVSSDSLRNASRSCQ
jgi:hypothetical protein